MPKNRQLDIHLNYDSCILYRRFLPCQFLHRENLSLLNVLLPKFGTNLVFLYLTDGKYFGCKERLKTLKIRRKKYIIKLPFISL